MEGTEVGRRNNFLREQVQSSGTEIFDLREIVAQWDYEMTGLRLEVLQLRKMMQELMGP